MQRFKLRFIVVNDIRVVRITRHEVLVVFLGWIEGLQRFNSGDNWIAEHFAGRQLANVREGFAVLRIARIKNFGAILLTIVRTLAVQFSRIMRNQEIDIEQLFE